MLAAALDQVACKVTAVEVEGEEFNPSCELLGDVARRPAGRAGQALRLVRARVSPPYAWRPTGGPIVLDRADGSLATLSMQGQPDRAVALKRRETSELIAEELRRLDPDDTYASALRYGVDRLGHGGEAKAAGGRPRTRRRRRTPRRPRAKKAAPAKKAAAK